MDRQTLTMLAQVLMLLVVGSPLGVLIWNGSTHLEWEYHLGILKSVQLSWNTLPLLWPRKGPEMPRVTRVATLAPQSRRPHSWLVGPWA